MTRSHDELRNVTITRGFTNNSPGSVLYECEGTRVLCTASICDRVPEWMEKSGKGWITAEYNMLPGSTSPRKSRERAGKIDGRTTEIQRLIGRSFRAVADLEKLGPRMITVDCDVIQADGGTRTASITGGFVALVEAIASIRNDLPDPGDFPLRASVAAVSCGMVNGVATLDLNYEQDFAADVDMNIVMTGSGQFIEIQGTGEEATFSEDELSKLIQLGKKGVAELTRQQAKSLGDLWPF